MASYPHSRHRGMGALASYTATSHGLEGQTPNARFRVMAYGPHTVRISVGRHEVFDDFSFAVVAEPTAPVQPLLEDDGVLRLPMDGFVLEITKDPVQFRFLKPDGTVINEDEPGLGTSWLGEQVTAYKAMQEGERFVGLGEKTGNLDRRGTGYTNWTTDYFAYPEEADMIYGAHPFYMGLHHGMVYGIFLDNTYKTHFNFGASTDRFSSFTAEDGDLNYYFFHGANPAEVLKAYTDLTGRSPMPPKWSLGYQQCRYSYYPDSELLTVAKTFRDKQIPADVVYCDIHYMDKYKIFSWDQERFPDPKGMMDTLRDQGFHLVVIADPGIKTQEGYQPYEDGVQQDIFIKYPDGKPYSGEVWPGWCHFPDFTDEKARDWWGEWFKVYTQDGLEGFWNDMNEPATWGQRIPELMEMSFEGTGGTMRRGRNVYGMQMARATYEGVKKHLNGKRPFNLTRSSYCGIQRYSAVWTGDNVADDTHMLSGVRLVNSLGLTGVPYTGPDVGGFVGEAGVDLFARWISIGAFTPFFRGHSMINSRDTEPWTFGEEVEEISRNYISLRYRLMPYIYGAFAEAAASGMPVSRSLVLDHAFEPEIYDGRFQNQFLCGPYILVAPVESDKQITKVYLPAGKSWYDLHTGELLAGGQVVYADCPNWRLPLYIQAGAILPMQSLVQSLTEKPEPVLHLHVYAGGQGTEYSYYEDDGETYGYEGGAYQKRTIRLQGNALSWEAAQGSYPSAFDTVKVYLHGFAAVDSVQVNGTNVATTQETHRYTEPITQFDPVGQPIPVVEQPVQTFTTAWTAQGVEVQL